MHQKEFEKYLRKKSEAYKPDYQPSPLMWEAIQDELLVKSRGFRYWNTFGVSVLILAVAGIIMLFSGLPNHQQEEVLVETNTEKYQVNESNQIVENQNSNLLDQENNANYNLVDGQQQHDVFNKLKNADAQNKSNGNDLKEARFGSSELVTSEEVEFQDQNIDVNTSTRSSIFMESSDVTTLSFETMILEKEKLTLNQKYIDKLWIENLQSIQSNGLQELIISNRSFDFSLVVPIDRADVRSGFKGKGLYGSLSFGIGQVSAQYQLLDNSQTQYLNYRKDHEHLGAQYELGMGLDLRLSKKWSLSTGINARYFQEEYNRLSSTTTIDTISDYTVEIPGENGVIITDERTVVLQTVTDRSEHYFTNRTILSIPLIMKYHIDLNDRFDISIGAGIEQSFLIQTKGLESSLSTEDLYDLSMDSENRTTSYMTQALLQFNINYSIADEWGLFFGVNYNYALTHMYSQSQLLNKKYNAVGLRSGVSLKF